MAIPAIEVSEESVAIGDNEATQETQVKGVYKELLAPLVQVVSLVLVALLALQMCPS